MKKEEVIKWLKIMKANLNSFPEVSGEKKIEALAEAIRLLKNEQSEIPTGSDDCISRKAVLEIYDEWFATCNIADKKESPKAKINALSPVTPIRPKAHWIYDYTSADGHRTYHCSKCGCYLKPKHSESLNSFKWCSLCGAEM